MNPTKLLCLKTIAKFESSAKPADPDTAGRASKFFHSMIELNEGIRLSRPGREGGGVQKN